MGLTKGRIGVIINVEVRKMELNQFDNALRELAISHAPKQIAKCGNIVISSAYWKHPHKVKITRVSVEICGIDLTIGQREELGITGWLIVQYEYIGKRLKANGEEVTGRPSVGFLLYEFETADKQHYKRIPSCFNHTGLVFDIETLK